MSPGLIIISSWINVRLCSSPHSKIWDTIKTSSGKIKKINLASPWERITVADAFLKYAPVTLEEALVQDKFDEIMVEYIEPHLGIDRPTFIYDYPAKLAALAKIKMNNPTVAERFELYIGGLEIANGFSELTDASEQRQRFEEALKLRAAKKLGALRQCRKNFCKPCKPCRPAPASLWALTVWL